MSISAIASNTGIVSGISTPGQADATSKAGGANVTSGAKQGGSSGADTTSTVTNANGSITTTVTGPNGVVLSSSTTGGSIVSAGHGQTVARGAGSPQSSGLVDLSV